MTMALPWMIQVEAFWSNSDQNGVTMANSTSTRSTARTPSTASSGCTPRARSSCMAAPAPPKPITRPSATSTAMTGSSAPNQASTSTASVKPVTARIRPGRPRSIEGAISAVRTTRRKPCGSDGVGGTTTYLRRPDQKMTVAMNIRMPGMPKAQRGPSVRRMIGISSEAKNEPKLMIQ